jgi:glycosyltransferase involved in cell wall biosynthesis
MDDTVSVVLPTILRDDLCHAVRSVRQQNASAELVIVVDRPEGARTAASREVQRALEDADVLLYTGGGAGASAARNAGIGAAQHEWIAYLDDDDEWLPDKLQRQLEAVRAYDGDRSSLIVSGQALQRWPNSAAVSHPVPASVIAPGQNVADYLFVRRSPSVARASLFLPTLIVNRTLARAVPWDETLRRHVDWDWLVRATSAGACVIQISHPVAIVTVGSPSSISASDDWEASFAWAGRVLRPTSSRAYVDFVAGQVLRFALTRRSLRGTKRAATVFIAEGAPSFQAVALGLTGLLPRRRAESAMRLVARIRKLLERHRGSATQPR